MNKSEQRLSVVFLDRAGIPERIQIPAPNTPYNWVNHQSTEHSNVIARAQHADIVVVNKVKINASILDACPRLKHIVVSATGYDVIDIAACEARGVSVSNIPSYAATTVAEHVIGTSLVLRREIMRYAQSVANGDWQKADAFCLFGKPFHNVSGATIGLIGMGEIARMTADKALALGMQVLFCARSERQMGQNEQVKQVSLNELLRHSDIVSVHCSLNPSTKNLIGEQEIAIMPDHSILINTARGGIVDEAAAVAAIKRQSIAGLAFDVSATEPPEDQSELLTIASLPNVLITPHIAWASEQAMQYLANTVTRNIDAFINNRPLNLVTQH